MKKRKNSFRVPRTIHVIPSTRVYTSIRLEGDFAVEKDTQYSVTFVIPVAF